MTDQTIARDTGKTLLAGAMRKNAADWSIHVQKPSLNESF